MGKTIARSLLSENSVIVYYKQDINYYCNNDKYDTSKYALKKFYYEVDKNRLDNEVYS